MGVKIKSKRGLSKYGWLLKYLLKSNLRLFIEFNYSINWSIVVELSINKATSISNVFLYLLFLLHALLHQLENPLNKSITDHLVFRVSNSK